MVQARSDDASEAVAGLLQEGNALLGAGRLAEARELLEQALARAPRNPKVQSALGLCSFRLGAFDRAAEMYALLVRENPVEAALRVNLGLVFLKQGDFAQAIRELQTACDLTPEHKKAQNYLGLALAQVGELPRARAAFVAAGSQAMVERMDKLLAGLAAPAEPNSEPASYAVLTAAPREAAPPAVPLPEVRPSGPFEPPAPPPEALARPASTGARAARPPSAAPAVLPAQSLPLDTGARAALGPGLLEQAAELGGPGTATFAIAEQLWAARIQGELLLRLDGLVGVGGQVALQPEVKRFRGRVTEKPFGRGSQRFVRASGQGVIWLARRPGFLTSVELADGAAYFLEERVQAFEEPLQFENGRLPGREGNDLHLLHLRGLGQVLLSTPGPLQRLELGAGSLLVIPPERLVGWVGALTPRLVASPVEVEEGETARMAVELTGEGHVVLSIAPPEERA